jgi:hypothetical protein
LKGLLAIKGINCVPNVKAEITFRRKFAGHTLRDEISNITIQNELKIFNIGEKIADRKQNCRENLVWMNPRRATRQTVTSVKQSNLAPEDKMGGRPVKTPI